VGFLQEETLSEMCSWAEKLCKPTRGENILGPRR
jgi:hypothetical protein